MRMTIFQHWLISIDLVRVHLFSLWEILSFWVPAVSNRLNSTTSIGFVITSSLQLAICLQVVLMVSPKVLINGSKPPFDQPPIAGVGKSPPPADTWGTEQKESSEQLWCEPSLRQVPLEQWSIPADTFQTNRNHFWRALVWARAQTHVYSRNHHPSWHLGYWKGEASGQLQCEPTLRQVPMEQSNIPADTFKTKGKELLDSCGVGQTSDRCSLDKWPPQLTNRTLKGTEGRGAHLLLFFEWYSSAHVFYGFYGSHESEHIILMGQYNSILMYDIISWFAKWTQSHVGSIKI